MVGGMPGRQISVPGGDEREQTGQDRQRGVAGGNEGLSSVLRPRPLDNLLSLSQLIMIALCR